MIRSIIYAKVNKRALSRICIVVVFGIAFAYIEAAVVVYLRVIFYPDGFTFPLAFGDSALWRRLLLSEVGREGATLVLILTSCRLIGRNRRQRLAYFLTIFAVWDIFYYVWLKVLLDWPGSVTDWDILFLMPVVWASPVYVPVLISLTMFVFAMVILWRDWCGRIIKVNAAEWLSFVAAIVAVIVSFCIAGFHIAEVNYKDYFHVWLFALGYTGAIALFLRCVRKPN